MPPDGPLASDFGQHHFGQAQLRHRRRTRCLVDLASRLARHPGGSLPEKFHDPNALRRCYDLMNHPAVTHDAVLQPHRRATFAGLARFEQPFSVAVSGLAAPGAVVWQDGLPDLRLRDTGQEGGRR